MESLGKSCLGVFFGERVILLMKLDRLLTKQSNRDLSFFNLTNILEHQTIAKRLKISTTLPSNIHSHSFSPSASSASSAPYLSKGRPTSQHLRLKALGGIIFNLAIAIIFTGYSDNPLAQAVIVANLLIACYLPFGSRSNGYRSSRLFLLWQLWLNFSP